MQTGQIPAASVEKPRAIAKIGFSESEMGESLRILHALPPGPANKAAEVPIDSQPVSIGLRELTSLEKKLPRAASEAAVMRRNAECEERLEMYHPSELCSQSTFDGSDPRSGVE